MEWKRRWVEFLSPTPLKNLLFIIIAIGIVPFIEYDNGIRCIQAPCPVSETGSLLSYLFRSYNLYVFNVNYLYLAAGLVLAYLSASALVLLRNAFSQYHSHR